MANSNFSERVILSVGGSLVAPHGGIDTQFLEKLNTFVRGQLASNPHRQFFLVVGGGATARQYRDAGESIVGHQLSRDDLDWLGIHATRLNAQLIRTIFKEVAHPYVLKHYEIIRKVSEQVVVAAGWKPGWSTDFCAVLLAEDYDISTIINLSNIDHVYDKDPNKYPDARPIEKISWEDFRKIVGDEWNPGMNAPFDPVASKRSQELKLKVVVLNGRNMENMENYFAGKEFVGTTIE